MADRRTRREVPVDGGHRFYQVKEVALMFGVSEQTIHRAIDEDEFPAVRIRNRKVIPAVVIDDMVAAARAGNRAVDAADWAAPGGG
ncbi:helix-turn-helix domain-containing protein [Umezawaea sp. Da 62-37]|uniref:helix-turn-helix domain-containing protein n=1 Tax=Umezawaea sp. Da 62-37 TaxID=3075927 RepID=UPI0028F73DD5|nr:helix-turn-helix domain-containing protein [Umezawaea sp. Da 62-37]WNV83088.1 helix-turn-helix domain-containing protein [Umezawaea sp. Da 62-37]